MKASRPGVLIALTVGTALVVWALLRLTGWYSDLPPLPWTAVPTLLLLALGELVTGVNIRGRLHTKPRPRADRRPPLKPIEPMVVARMAALAKASTHAAAVLAGVFGGFVVSLSSALDKNTPRSDFIVSVGTFVSALVLVGAALFLEYACRVPKNPEDNGQPT